MPGAELPGRRYAKASSAGLAEPLNNQLSTDSLVNAQSCGLKRNVRQRSRRQGHAMGVEPEPKSVCWTILEELVGGRDQQAPWRSCTLIRLLKDEEAKANGGEEREVPGPGEHTAVGVGKTGGVSGC